MLACPGAGRGRLAEDVVLATALADPDVRALVRGRFVPVRTPAAPPPACGATGQRPAGELRAEGPTLMVSTPEGTFLASLAGPDTFDRDRVLEFLRGALDGVPPAGGGGDPWALLAAGRLEEAGALFAAMDSPEGRYGLARLASLRGDHARALRLAEPLARRDGPFRHEAGFERASALMRLGRADEARAAFREVAEGAPGPRAEEARYWLGCLLDRAGDAARAQAAWRVAAERAADPAVAARAKARLLWPGWLAARERLTPVPARIAADRAGECLAGSAG